MTQCLVLKKNAPLVVAFFLLFFACADSEQRFRVEDVPDPKQSDGGYVSNPDEILSADIVDQINSQLESLDQQQTAQVAVVVLNSIGEQVPKDFAVELFNHWKIGDAEKDNGLLILLVKDQRRVEFETGYGLEADLPDVTCFQIQQDYMVPYFKSEDYDNGLLQGVQALVNHLSGSNPSANESNEITDAPPADNESSEFSEMTWDENTYTLETNRKLSFLQAWTFIRDVNEFYQLPAVPDTTLSTMEETSRGFRYTIKIPYEVSVENVFQQFWYSFGFLFVYAVIVLIVAFASFSGHRRKYYKQKKRVTFELFSNPLFSNNRFIFIFLLTGPIVLIEIYFFRYNELDVPIHICLAAAYITWCTYVHLHYMILLPAKARSLSGSERHVKYNSLAEAYRNLNVFVYLFPLPFLIVFYAWHRARMRRLRETAYTCECGATMVKLDESADDKFLTAGDVREEVLRSVDYDVWVCNVCNRQRILRHENFRSPMMRCNTCSKKTVRHTQRETVVDSTTSSSGYGYNHYQCANCGEMTKIKFTIPKKSDSSSSSGSSSSGSSSWGGGSSGGGGAGSSW